MKKASLNGQIARVLPRTAWPGERVGIKLPDGTKLSCKPTNLSLIGISASVPSAVVGGGGETGAAANVATVVDAPPAPTLPRAVVASCSSSEDGAVFAAQTISGV